MPDRKLVLDNASQAVLHQRNKSYGEPDEDFQRIARIASAMGFRFTSDGFNRELTGADVALFMIALKTSRLTWSPSHQDSWTDIAGYAACGFETARLEEERRKPWNIGPGEVVTSPAPVPLEVETKREGHQRLGVSEERWREIVRLANRVLNGEPPSVLEDEKFMLIRRDDGPCNPTHCRADSHSFKSGCEWRIRLRRYWG